MRTCQHTLDDDGESVMSEEIYEFPEPTGWNSSAVLAPVLFLALFILTNGQLVGREAP